MSIANPQYMDFGSKDGWKEAVVCEPVPVSEQMMCRRGTGSRSSCQGQPVPTCDGILKPFESVEGMFSCGKCGMTHAIIEVNGEKRYGAVL